MSPSSCPGTRARTAAAGTSRLLGDAVLRGKTGRRVDFAGRRLDGDDIAIVCRNTTEAINHLAYRLRLSPHDTIVTTVIEHHANLLPWARLCRRRYVECGRDGTFSLDDVIEALDGAPRPKLLAITGASNVTGWLPPIDDIIEAAHDREHPDPGGRRPGRAAPPAACHR